MLFIKDIKTIHTCYQLYLQKRISINGWIKNCRFQKNFFFIDLNDGTFVENLQVICKENVNTNFSQIKADLKIGASLKIEGDFVKTLNKKTPFELVVSKITVLGKSSLQYPIQPKKHSKSFLRKVAHLRLRTNLFGVIFRIRNTVTCAIHDFFQKEGFINIHTPILTANDGEGTGALFQVTTLNLDQIAKNKNEKINYKQDFFGKPTFLTVTGQLEAEAFATAFNKVYTFSPTFRAEKSNTQRHISEFWMIEPEMAFCDLKQNIKLAQKMIKYIIHFCLKSNFKDFEFLDNNITTGLIKRLESVVDLKEFPQIKYREAIDILTKNQNSFKQKPFYGDDLSTEHEKYLTDVIFKKPVFVIDWPKKIKAFYMKNNPDNETVAAMDLLVPGIGELIGGSQREDQLEVLKNKIQEFKIPLNNLEWYLDLRRFGSCVHSGFGLGLERLLLYLTGLENIRDVIAFPRNYRDISF
ncbi:asparagine--tRNA ligase [Candidatus Phytoplasma melaleucae]|uniref:Asparagine--tRNA ligase n=1 Tax=Candidatus Phytoplasma melaleucae TaxID=2982630 RepID=A0ABT9DFD8_9MOLU|nr:asparagine--tRNA ligase ['Melaleuca sp.' phytoplasma]MDO8168056.1 asparagine--tRNA ligase ['Melaleuca sp.' phytoplasma]MDV3205337.1 asparagine--tRNA ligase [Weeping tea tree witches'-broom phytoplasma]